MHPAVGAGVLTNSLPMQIDRSQLELPYYLFVSFISCLKIIPLPLCVSLLVIFMGYVNVSIRRCGAESESHPRTQWRPVQYQAGLG